jgi:hypothetical protein
MADIVDLSARREAGKLENYMCFTCACGGQLFILRPDAKLQCKDCALIQPRLIWGEFFRSETINPPDHAQT